MSHAYHLHAGRQRAGLTHAGRLSPGSRRMLEYRGVFAEEARRAIGEYYAHQVLPLCKCEGDLPACCGTSTPEQLERCRLSPGLVRGPQAVTEETQEALRRYARRRRELLL